MFKNSGITIVFFIVCVLVLAAAFGIGLGIRKMRTPEADKAPVAASEPNKREVARQQLPGGGREPRSGPVSEEDRARTRDERVEMVQRFESMSEEERAEFRAQMAQRFSGGPGGRRRDENLTPEERTAREEQRRQMNPRRRSWPPIPSAQSLSFLHMF